MAQPLNLDAAFGSFTELLPADHSANGRLVLAPALQQTQQQSPPQQQQATEKDGLFPLAFAAGCDLCFPDGVRARIVGRSQQCRMNGEPVAGASDDMAVEEDKEKGSTAHFLSMRAMLEWLERRRESFGTRATVSRISLANRRIASIAADVGNGVSASTEEKCMDMREEIATRRQHALSSAANGLVAQHQVSDQRDAVACASARTSAVAVAMSAVLKSNGEPAEADARTLLLPESPLVRWFAVFSRVTVLCLANNQLDDISFLIQSHDCGGCVASSTPLCACGIAKGFHRSGSARAPVLEGNARVYGAHASFGTEHMNDEASVAAQSLKRKRRVSSFSDLTALDSHERSTGTGAKPGVLFMFPSLKRLDLRRNKLSRLVRLWPLRYAPLSLSILILSENPICSHPDVARVSQFLCPQVSRRDCELATAPEGVQRGGLFPNQADVNPTRHRPPFLDQRLFESTEAELARVREERETSLNMRNQVGPNKLPMPQRPLSPRPPVAGRHVFVRGPSEQQPVRASQPTFAAPIVPNAHPLTSAYDIHRNVGPTNVTPANFGVRTSANTKPVRRQRIQRAKRPNMKAAAPSRPYKRQSSSPSSEESESDASTADERGLNFDAAPLNAIYRARVLNQNHDVVAPPPPPPPENAEGIYPFPPNLLPYAQSSDAGYMDAPVSYASAQTMAGVQPNMNLPFANSRSSSDSDSDSDSDSASDSRESEDTSGGTDDFSTTVHGESDDDVERARLRKQQRTR